MGIPLLKEGEKDGFQKISPMLALHQAPLSPSIPAAQRQQVQKAQKRIIDDHFKLSPANLRWVTRGMSKLPATATPAQKEAALKKLFQRIRIGGTLGIKYQTGVKPKTPNEVATSRRGDCDELCKLFIAAARYLNIPITGIKLATFTAYNSTRGGSGRQSGHAALFITTKTGKYVYDFTMGNNPIKVTDFSYNTLLKRVYRGNQVPFPGGLAPLTAMSMPEVFTTLNDVVAIGSLERATYENTKGQIGKAKTLLEDAKTLNPQSQVVVKEMQNVASNIVDSYDAAGNKYYKLYKSNYRLYRSAKTRSAKKRYYGLSQGYYRLSVARYKEVLKLIKMIPAIKNAKIDELHNAHESLGLLYQAKGRNTDALKEFNEMIKLKPNNGSGYLKKMSLFIKLGGRTRNVNKKRQYFTNAVKTGKLALTRLTIISSGYDEIKEAVKKISIYMRKQGWPVP